MTFAVKKREISERDLDLFEKIKEILDYLKGVDIKRNGYEGDVAATAHILCSAFSDVFNLELTIKSGFHQGDKHYWLKTNSGLIIDLLPLGVLSGPIFIDPWVLQKSPYQESQLNDFGCMQFGVCIERVKKAILYYLHM